MKQSSLSCGYGLLRFARNDGFGYVAFLNFSARNRDCLSGDRSGALAA